MIKLQLKLSMVKQRLKLWNRHVFGNVFDKVKTAEQAVAYA